MTQNYPAYQLAFEDMERLKIVAARIFDRNISPQSRLEIIARSAGFKTYAAMLAELKNGPIRLNGDQKYEEDHIKTANIDQSLVPYINGISLNEIISAGLAWTFRDNPETSYGVDQSLKLESLRTDGGSLFRYLRFLEKDISPNSSFPGVYRCSMSWSDIRSLHSENENKTECERNAIIISSPRNAREMSVNLMTGKSNKVSGCQWRAGRVDNYQEDEFFESPTSSVIDLEDKEKMEQLISKATLFLFDFDDVSEFRNILYKMGINNIPEYRFYTVKKNLDHAEDDVSRNFLEAGSSGMTNMDIPHNISSFDDDGLSKTAFTWLSAMTNCISLFEREMKRLSRESQNSLEMPSKSIFDRFVVRV